MAKIKEELLIVKISTLVKEGADSPEVFNTDVIGALEEAISEMVGSGHIVEIIKDI